jgi:isocitrate dehydrogenase
MKRPEGVDVVIFRENTEDIYTGIEFQYGTEDHKKFMEMFRDTFNPEYKAMRFPETS